MPGIQQLAQQSEQVYLFANNHWQGQAVDTQSPSPAPTGHAQCPAQPPVGVDCVWAGGLGLAARRLKMLLGM